ncbi:hypothetical protein BD779DRAFT_1672079 [Infundibulicybe gibba]|nr:hypothetical protein BD779DRAFT_1672079 [Infundibulicybe gibba]
MESLLAADHPLFSLECMTLDNPNDPHRVTPSHKLVTCGDPGRPLCLVGGDPAKPADNQIWTAALKDGKLVILSTDGPLGFSWGGGENPGSGSPVILDEPNLFVRLTKIESIQPPEPPVFWLQPVITHLLGADYFVGRDDDFNQLQYHSYPIAPPFEKDMTVWKATQIYK